MTKEPQLYEIELSANQVIDAERFEAERRDAYTLKDQDERAEQLTRIVRSAKVTGDIALEDVVLEKITHPEGEPSEADRQVDEATKRFEEISNKVASAETRRGHAEPTYRIAVDSNGEVRALSRIEPIAEDKEATKRNQHTASRIGYGPKMNDSSFRTSNVSRGQVKL